MKFDTSHIDALLADIEAGADEGVEAKGFNPANLDDLEDAFYVLMDDHTKTINGLIEGVISHTKVEVVKAIIGRIEEFVEGDRCVDDCDSVYDAGIDAGYARLLTELRTILADVTALL